MSCFVLPILLLSFCALINLVGEDKADFSANNYL